MLEFYNFASESPWLTFFLFCSTTSFIYGIYKTTCRFILSWKLKLNLLEESNKTDTTDSN